MKKKMLPYEISTLFLVVFSVVLFIWLFKQLFSGILRFFKGDL